MFFILNTMTITLDSAYQRWLDAGSPTTCFARTAPSSLSLFIDDLWSTYDYHMYDECDFIYCDKFLFDLFTKDEFNSLMNIIQSVDAPA